MPILFYNDIYPKFPFHTSKTTYPLLQNYPVTLQGLEDEDSVFIVASGIDGNQKVATREPFFMQGSDNPAASTWTEDGEGDTASCGY